MRDEYDLAEPHLLRALELSPRNVVAMTNLAVVRYFQGRRDDALPGGVPVKSRCK